MIPKLFVFSTAMTFTASCFAGTPIHSSKNDFTENPFVAVGVNPRTGAVTGYFSARLTRPGRTDACKFAFRGVPGPDGRVRLTIKDAVPGTLGEPQMNGKDLAMLSATQGSIDIALPHSLAPGDCDWVLGAVGGPNIRTDKQGFILSMPTETQSDYIGVATILSKRAVFHSAPSAATARTAFLVAGDMAYVTDEKPGWYHVRFTHALKETVGWIKASDTVRFDGQ